MPAYGIKSFGAFASEKSAKRLLMKLKRVEISEIKIWN